MRQVPTYLIIGNGRVANHFEHYFQQLGLTYHVWHRGYPIESLVAKLQLATHVLLLIHDKAIEGVIKNQLYTALKRIKKKCSDVVLIHFSGSLITNMAYGAHPLMTFSSELYTFEQYKALPFVIDEDAPDFSALLPGLPNSHWRLAKNLKEKYHALCVLSGNFSCLLWNKLFDDFAAQLNLPPDIAHPYLQQQMHNLLHYPKQALTGPLVRNDEQTIKKNIAALEGDAYQAIYQSFIAAYQAQQKNK